MAAPNNNNKNNNNNDDEKKNNVNDDINDPENPRNPIHYKARSNPYPEDAHSKRDKQITRFRVEDNQVLWKVEFKNYKPIKFTDSGVLNHKIPDKKEEDIEKLKIKYGFNTVDDKNIDRRSHEGNYELDASYYNLPKNPRGRTGICGRGLLWRWGPNHAADPIVTRWKRKGGIIKKNEIVKDKITGKPILEFVAIERTDGGGWAIPGGMVNPGEQISRTLKREFGEETMDTIGITSEKEKKKIAKQLDNFFKNGGKEIYKGYVDDPRATDNAWIETVAVNFHDEKGNLVGKWKLKAGDDASKVKWMEISKNLKLYASHNWLIKQAVKLHDAHW